MVKIILNRIRTPDGTVLTSRNRHDYVTYEDANGEQYMVDGGTDYLRRNVNKEPAQELSVYDDIPYEEIRETIEWGTYGKRGDQPLKWVKLSNMNSDHIRAVLKECRPYYKEHFEHELKYRRENAGA